MTTKTIFVSGELSSLSKLDNNERTNKLRSILLIGGYNFKPIKGYYKGISEESFAIEVNTKELKELKKIAKSFNQESILVINNKTLKASLVFLQDDTRVKLGIFHEVDKNTAMSYDNYSFYPEKQKYFITKYLITREA